MIFTSGTQELQGRAVSHDPKPIVNLTTGRRHTREGYGVARGDTVKWVPRPKFAVLDNPILADFREEHMRWQRRLARHEGHTLAWRSRLWLRDALDGDFTPGQINHARRVLTRLTNWKEGTR